MRFLGEISYSIYCFHAPVIFLSAWAVVDRGVNYAALPLVKAPNGTMGYFVFPPWAIIPLLAVIILVATAVHYCIERPSRELLNGHGCRLPVPPLMKILRPNQSHETERATVTFGPTSSKARASTTGSVDQPLLNDHGTNLMAADDSLARASTSLALTQAMTD